MFTGIVQGIGKITRVHSLTGLMQCSVAMSPKLLANLEVGASISVDGVCLTVVNFNSSEVKFDVIQETLHRTTLSSLQNGGLVNIERAACFGQEIGGHILSGHIYGTAVIHAIDRTENNCIIFLKSPMSWTKYLFSKGYIALNGVSLTLVDVDKEEGMFSVHLIPETLEKTTFGIKKVNDIVNVEIDSQTQTIVETVEALYRDKTNTE